MTIWRNFCHSLPCCNAQNFRLCNQHFKGQTNGIPQLTHNTKFIKYIMLFMKFMLVDVYYDNVQY